ncbi:hypothetical protein GCM10009801_40920 [Streptomyces albiaxialis]|uniref:Uncharacterized protein n=1 Tax=Streptomyces albiaxialis TaxID=329523 RepID=A0ABN2W609_9ACTN
MTWPPRGPRIISGWLTPTTSSLPRDEWVRSGADGPGSALRPESALDARGERLSVYCGEETRSRRYAMILGIDGRVRLLTFFAMVHSEGRGGLRYVPSSRAQQAAYAQSAPYVFRLMAGLGL